MGGFCSLGDGFYSRGSRWYTSRLKLAHAICSAAPGAVNPLTSPKDGSPTLSAPSWMYECEGQGQRQDESGVVNADEHPVAKKQCAWQSADSSHTVQHCAAATHSQLQQRTHSCCSAPSSPPSTAAVQSWPAIHPTHSSPWPHTPRASDHVHSTTHSVKWCPSGHAAICGCRANMAARASSTSASGTATISPSNAALAHAGSCAGGRVACAVVVRAGGRERIKKEGKIKTNFQRLQACRQRALRRCLWRMQGPTRPTAFLSAHQGFY